MSKFSRVIKLVRRGKQIYIFTNPLENINMHGNKKEKSLQKRDGKYMLMYRKKFPETPSSGLPTCLLMSKALIAWKPRLEAF